MAVIGSSLSAKCFSALFTNQVPDGNIVVSSTTAQGRTETVLDLSAGNLIVRDFEIAFSWPLSAGTTLFVFQPSVIAYPENAYNRVSDWIDLKGAKFIQGYSIRANSFGVGKIFQLQSGDDQSLHSLVEIPVGGTVFANPSRKVFSCVPFVCHSLRRVTSDDVAWQVWEEEPIFVPYPEMQMNWTTELTALGGDGWQHLRYLNFAYVSTTAITLSFAVDSGSGAIAPVTITIPSSGGQQAKAFLQMSPNKWELIGFSAVSSAPFGIWLPECEVVVKSWGETGPYRILHPFGSQSSPEAHV